MAETSTKPYFIRALHEWCTDNGLTPHLVVQVDENTRVPMAFVRDGQITLNIGDTATHQLKLGNEFIEFQARFGGKTEMLWVPIGAVTAIYAKETGTGMGFEAQASTAAQPTESSQEPDAPKTDDPPKRPHLKIVK
jgi:stringent starvation protein B